MDQDRFDDCYADFGPHMFLYARYWEENNRYAILLQQHPTSRSTVLRRKITIHNADQPMPEKATWTRDDEPDTGPPRSYGYSIPWNEQELQRARTQGHEWLDHAEKDAPPIGSGAVVQEIRFYAKIIEEFECWFREHGFEIPEETAAKAPEAEGPFFNRLARLQDDPADRHRRTVQELLPRTDTQLRGTGYEGDVEDIAAAVADRVQEVPTGDQPQLLDIDAVAEYLDVSPRTVDTIIDDGDIRPIWVRGQRRFTEEAIEAYLQNSVGTEG